MKKLFYLLLLLSGVASAQPAIQWQNSYGGTLKDGLDVNLVLSAQVNNTADGGYIFTGYSYSNDGDVTGHHGLPATRDAWVVKLDSIGTIEWQRSLGGSQDESGLSVIQTSDGGYLVSIETNSDDGDVTGFHPGTGLNTDMWLVKLDAMGNFVWGNCFGGSSKDLAHSVIEASDGNYVIAGRANSSDGDVIGNHGSSDIWMLKISPAGALIWQRCIGGSSGEYPYTIRETADQGFILSGDGNSTDGDFAGLTSSQLGSVFVLKTDSAANVEWVQLYGGNFIEFGFEVAPAPDGGYYTGSASSSNDLPGFIGGTDYWIQKLDSAGNVIWSNCYGGTVNDFFKAFQVTPDGGLILAGNTRSNDGNVSNLIGVSDAWIVKLDTLGNIEWEHSYGGTDLDDPTSIIITPDGGLLIGATSNSNDIDVSGHHGSTLDSDIWIAKLAPVFTGIQPVNSDAISGIAVSPVPVSQSAVIDFYSNKATTGTIQILDITGRVVIQLYEGVIQAGINQFQWNLNENNETENGIYFVKVNTDAGFGVQKILVTR